MQASGEQSPPLNVLLACSVSNDLCFLLGLPRLLLCSLPLTASLTGRGCSVVAGSSYKKLSPHCLPITKFLHGFLQHSLLWHERAGRRRQLSPANWAAEFSLCLSSSSPVSQQSVMFHAATHRRALLAGGSRCCRRSSHLDSAGPTAPGNSPQLLWLFHNSCLPSSS